MNRAPKISIIVRVYNQEKLIGQALDSIIGQTLPDIELICIDNCSSDGTVAIVQEYAQRDTRIHLIVNQKDLGLLNSDIKGIQEACGEYITFVDGDDTIPLDACERMYETAQTSEADIVQFPITLRVNEGVGREHEAALSAFFQPYPISLYDEEIARKSVLERKYAWSIIGKMFRNEICKRAVEGIVPQYLTHADDMILYTFIAFFAKSYVGKADIQPCYIYSVGTGETTSTAMMSLAAFKKKCSVLRAKDLLMQFFTNQNALEEHMDYCNQIPQNLMHDILYIWLNKVDPAQQRGAFAFLCKKAPSELIAGSVLDIHYIRLDLEKACDELKSQVAQKTCTIQEQEEELRKNASELHCCEIELKATQRRKALEKAQYEEERKRAESEKAQYESSVSQLKDRMESVKAQHELSLALIRNHAEKMEEQLSLDEVKRTFKIQQLLTTMSGLGLVGKVKMLFQVVLHLLKIKKMTVVSEKYALLASSIEAMKGYAAEKLADGM